MRKSLGCVFPFLCVAPVFAQLPPAATWASTAPSRHQVFSNLTYLTTGTYESKLDVFRRRDAEGPHPTLIYFHGGGWVSGHKEDGVLYTLPWMEMGWNVVNVEYRLGPAFPAPAAVEDCLCALRWIVSHAAQYRIDPAGATSQNFSFTPCFRGPQMVQYALAVNGAPAMAHRSGRRTRLFSFTS